MKKITIVTGQHLIFNPRVWKEANTLCESGYEVTIFTTWYSTKYRQDDKLLLNNSIAYLSSFSLIPSAGNSFSIFYARVLKKVANYIFILFNVSSVYQLLYMPRRQLKCILNRPSDLFICHQEAGLLIGKELIKQGKKAAFDFEDWYSEDYLKRDRPIKLLQAAELFAFQRGLYISCPSKAMAAILEEKYGKAKKIKPIYNSFITQQNKVEQVEKIPNSLVWFSQVVGPDRGIEDFIKSIEKYKTSLQIHLIGKCSESYKSFLHKLIQETSHSLHLHGLLEHNDLIKFLQKFEIGLALENTYPINKNVTISNKILLYLHLGIKVIATSTLGHLELNNTYQKQLVYINSNDSESTQNILNQLLNYPSSYSEFSISDHYSWEFTRCTILSLVNESIDI